MYVEKLYLVDSTNLSDESSGKYYSLGVTIQESPWISKSGHP